MTDELDDRMRIMIPVITLDPDDHDLMLTLLSANFDRAMDAKYAVHEDMVWSSFLHRLSRLTEAFSREIAKRLDAVVRSE